MTEIAYEIHSIHTDSPPHLIIRLIEAKKEVHTLKPIPANHPFTLAQLRQLSAPQDKEVIDFLTKEELQYQNALTGRPPLANSTQFQLIHLKQAQIVPALKLMANTQKLFYKGKQLVVDFFGKVELYYQIQVLDSQKIKVEGRLKWRETDIALSDCDLIGPGKPHWFIRGISLKGLSTEINWKNLQQASQALILEGAQKTTFLDSLDPDDLETPQAVVVGGTLQDASYASGPLPILVLKDRTGAFADLWMDYGHGLRVSFHDPRQGINQTFEARLKRQLEAEKNWEKDLLETDFIKKIVSHSHYYCPLDKIAKSLTFLLEIGWHIQDWKGNQVIKPSTASLAIDQRADRLVIKGKMQYENYETDLSDVFGAFNRRERFVQIAEGKVGLIPDKWEQAGLQELVEEGEIIGKECYVKRSRLGAIAPLFDQAQLTLPLMSLKDRLKDFSQIESAIPAASFKGELRPYQQHGLNWLSFLVDYGFHGILADDMGLGKTVQVLALLSRLPQNHPHLIVVPTSLLFNWKKEFERFLPDTIPYLHYGPQRLKTSEELSKYPVILTSYTTLRLDLPLFEKLVYQSLILDEAQVIKNAHTQTAQAVFRLQSHFRLSITGTPLENHLGELWSHFRFLMPDLLGEEESFNAELQAAVSDHRYLQRIKKKISPFILRRKKEEVAKDLPERIDQIVWVEMEEEQRRLYDQFLTGIKGNLLKKVESDGAGKYRLEILEALLRLRQICCHPLLASASFDETTSFNSAKFQALEQDLETAIDEGRKVLIYSQFTSMLKLMTKRAQERGWRYSYLDGSTVNREKVVSSFQEDPSIPLFFISLKAGGVGLNLTAADYVFLYDPWWNDAVEEQAINRVHRIGRHETVIAKRFVTVESIEERMMKLKMSKRLMVEEMLEGEGNPLNLTAEDLLYLLG